MLLESSLVKLSKSARRWFYICLINPVWAAKALAADWMKCWATLAIYLFIFIFCSWISSSITMNWCSFLSMSVFLTESQDPSFTDAASLWRRMCLTMFAISLHLQLWLLFASRVSLCLSRMRVCRNGILSSPGEVSCCEVSVWVHISAFTICIVTIWGYSLGLAFQCLCSLLNLSSKHKTWLQSSSERMMYIIMKSGVLDFFPPQYLKSCGINCNSVKWEHILLIMFKIMIHFLSYGYASEVDYCYIRDEFGLFFT